MGLNPFGIIAVTMAAKMAEKKEVTIEMKKEPLITTKFVATVAVEMIILAMAIFSVAFFLFL